MGSWVLYARMGFVDLLPSPPLSRCLALPLSGGVTGPWGVGFLLPLGRIGVFQMLLAFRSGLGGLRLVLLCLFVLCVLVGGAWVFRVASPVLPWSGK